MTLEKSISCSILAINSLFHYEINSSRVFPLVLLKALRVFFRLSAARCPIKWCYILFSGMAYHLCERANGQDLKFVNWHQVLRVMSERPVRSNSPQSLPALLSFAARKRSSSFLLRLACLPAILQEEFWRATNIFSKIFCHKSLETCSGIRRRQSNRFPLAKHQREKAESEI